MKEYVLPSGHRLYTEDHIHGVIEAPSGCSKVILLDRGDEFSIDKHLPGVFGLEEGLKWLREGRDE